MVFQLLTDRQGEILRQHCDGKTESEIAETLGIGLASVKGVYQQVKNRLRTDSMEEACRMAASGESPPAIFRKHVVSRLKPRPTDGPTSAELVSDKPLWRRYPIKPETN